jgi:hypothetical protein
MTPEVNADEVKILKEALHRVIESTRDPSREEIEKIIGSKAMTILGSVSKIKAKGGKRKPTTETAAKLSDRAKMNAKEEAVRQALREAETVEQITSAIQSAKELEMMFEVSLGERKLEKISAAASTTVSSRE